MRSRPRFVTLLALLVGFLACVPEARAQQRTPDESKWNVDLGIGNNFTLNGNVNSGAIGTLQGRATAILPNPYGDVYGTGLELRFGGGYALNSDSELRGVFVYQSADADLVRLGDIGPSSLYGQYSDYKSFGLDLGYRRYVPLASTPVRLYGEANIGVAIIDRINLQLAAPTANIIFDQTDFYDGTAALTLGLNFGVLFRLTELVDLNAQVGLRHVGGLAQVDQFIGTGLEDINNDTGRLTFPVVVGVRFRLK
jgi:hypothetical protein